jgi:AraC-like DNA-binding protein
MNPTVAPLQSSNNGPRMYIESSTFRLGRHVFSNEDSEWNEQRQLTGDPFIAFSETPIEASFDGHWPAVLSRSNVATPAIGAGYTRIPRSSAGHRVSWIRTNSSLMSEIVCRHDPSSVDRPNAPFEHMTAPAVVRASALVDWLSRAAFQHKIAIDPMLFDEIALTVIDLTAQKAAEVAGRRSRKRGATPRKQREIANSICMEISTRYEEKLTIADLASSLDISPAYLSRIFRLQTGQSIHQYLVCTRLLNALSMLPEYNGSLAALAARCGFSSHAHLTSTCTALLGRPPRQLDRKNAIQNLMLLMCTASNAA